MNNRSKRTFRPGAEAMEGRCLATAGVAEASVGLHALAAQRVSERALVRAERGAAHVHPAANSGSGPSGAAGVIRLGLPQNFLDYGVVTLWNNSRTTASFTVSASTFQNGRPFSFILQSGQVQSFFAPVVGTSVPVFRVRFNANPANVFTLANENIVFQGPGYTPSATAGWPYRIDLGPNGYYTATI